MVHKSKTLEALDAESWAWIADAYPDVLAGIEADIASGITPDELRRLVVGQFGEHRIAFARRVEQAARHSLRVQQRMTT